MRRKLGSAAESGTGCPAEETISPSFPTMSGFNLAHLHPTWLLLPFSLPGQSVQKALQISFVPLSS